MIAAALSLQDPRERPVEQQAQADQLHARFKDPTSRLPDLAQPLALPARRSSASCRSSAFRRMCKREYLNYLRVREWQDFESQLRQVCKELKVDLGKPAARHRRGARTTPTASTRRCCPGCSPTSALLEEREQATGRRHAAARPAGVPRRPRHAVRDLPRQRPAREEPGVPDGRRAGRDRPALGPAERRDQARVGRAARRPPGQAHLHRAALVEEARRGDGLRAGHACTASRWSPTGSCQLRQGRPRRWPASCSSGTRSCTASGPAGTASSPRTSGCSRRPRSSSTAPGAATSSSTSTRCSTSTTPGSAPRSSAARTSTPGGSRSGSDRPDLLTFDPAMLTHDTAEEVRADGLPRGLAGRGPDLPDQLPLRAGRRRRRAHHRRAGGDPQPGRRRRLLLERAGRCARSWSPA